MMDDDLYLIHHYLQKGQDMDKLCNLSYCEKLFYSASLLIEKEEEKQKWEKLSELYLH